MVGQSDELKAAAKIASAADGLIGRRPLSAFPARGGLELHEMQHDWATLMLGNSGRPLNDTLGNARAILTDVAIQHAAAEEAVYRSSGVLGKLAFQRSEAASVAGRLGGEGPAKTLEDLIGTKLSNDDLTWIRQGEFDKVSDPKVADRLSGIVATAHLESRDKNLEAAIARGEPGQIDGKMTKSKGPSQDDVLSMELMGRRGAER